MNEVDLRPITLGEVLDRTFKPENVRQGFRHAESCGVRGATGARSRGSTVISTRWLEKRRAHWLRLSNWLHSAVEAPSHH